MRRDMDLIRRILLVAEEGTPNAAIDGYTADQLKYHRALAIEGGLLKGAVQKDNRRAPTNTPSAVFVEGLTWTGHEFIDKIRGDPKWKRVKDWLQKAGEELSIETIKIAVTALAGKLSDG